MQISACVKQKKKNEKLDAMCKMFIQIVNRPNMPEQIDGYI